jgi:DNA-binding transcriptional ArsR family regulator
VRWHCVVKTQRARTEQQFSREHQMRKRRHRRHEKNGRSQENQYWNLPYSMARSDSFRRLGGPALKILVELRCRFCGYNNGKITLSMDEAARLLGLSKGTVSRALVELQDKGFIQLKRRGRWYGRRASEWSLSMCSLNGLPATNEWRNWRAQKPLREARKINSRYPDDLPGIIDGAA